MSNEHPKRRAPGALELASFTDEQKQALLDLLVLDMYMDGNLARAEEARVQQLLGAMGFKSDFDRDREFDASVTRIRRQTQTPDDANAYAAKLATCFTAREQQQHVYDYLSDLAALDGRVSPEESKFLSAINAAFKL
jgi:hypothetical protein